MARRSARPSGPSTAPKAASKGTASPLAPPRFARVRRIRLIRQEIRELLSAGAVDLLLAHSEIVLEGGSEISVRAGANVGRFFATLMVTIDLPACAKHFREPADTATAERVAELLADAPELPARLTDLARPRLAQLTGLTADSLELTLEPHVRGDGVRVLVDADVVAWQRRRRQG